MRLKYEDLGDKDLVALALGARNELVKALAERLEMRNRDIEELARAMYEIKATHDLILEAQATSLQDGEII